MLPRMARRYDSSRRQAAARQTRRDILQAALRLHWDGVTEYGPLAREAGCSLATVRKHFPTRESLFRNCTRAFADSLEPPDLEALAGIADARRRTAACVAELCRIHEAMLGYAWLSARLREESPTLDAELAKYEALTDAVAAVLRPPDQAGYGLVRGLLDFLSYRALRLAGGRTPEQAARDLAATIQSLPADTDETNRPAAPP